MSSLKNINPIVPGTKINNRYFKFFSINRIMEFLSLVITHWLNFVNDTVVIDKIKILDINVVILVA